jgi:hypothetical protein
MRFYRTESMSRFTAGTERLAFAAIGLLLCLVCFAGSNVAESQIGPVPIKDVSDGVPRTLKFSGELLDLNGKPISGISGITFALYKMQAGGVPIWSETLNVTVDSRGRFTVMLGSSKISGIPADIISEVAPRWVAFTPEDGIERRRSELSSVPYSLVSADSEMLGGKSALQFATVDQLRDAVSSLVRALPLAFSDPSHSPLFSNVERANRFEALAQIGPSFISDATTGAPLLVKSTTLVPNLNVDMLHGLRDSDLATLNGDNDFLGLQKLRKGLLLAPSVLKGLAPSATLDFQARALTSDPNVMSERVFRWAANPVAETGNTSARLNLLFGTQQQDPTPTGFGLNEDGTLQFSTSQQFPAGAILAAIGEIGAGGPPNPPIVYTDPYRWKQTPPVPKDQNGVQPGWNSITLSPCPNGVSGSDSWHYLFISGTGTPETVLIIGGTCVSAAKTGTIEFSAVFAHTPGYTIESATSGLQEAANAALLPGGQAARGIVINPGEYVLRARLSLRANGLSISGIGATLTCATTDTCIMLGDPSNSNLFTRIHLTGIRVRPGIVHGSAPAIEDNANGSEMNEITAAAGTNETFTFGHLIQVDNDQAAFMDRIDNGGIATVTCDKQFCGSSIYAPGPFATRAAVGWVSHSNLSPQCGGNGIDWQSGNTLQVSDTVVQGYAQFGIRAGVAKGGFGNVKLNNVYEEAGGCPMNPIGNVGRAGIIVEGGEIRISGGEGPQGEMPCFTATCTSEKLRRYYAVARDSTGATANPLAFGVAENTQSPVTFSWPDMAGATSYDILAMDDVIAWYSGNSPAGTGPFAVALNVSKSYCRDGVCNYVDSHTPLLNYSVGSPTYFPLINFWPGSIILGSESDSHNLYSASILFADVAPIGIIAELGVLRPAVLADSCQSESAVSPIWESCLTSWYPPNPYTATLMVAKNANDGGLFTNLKGRLNFATLGSSPSHIVTLSDSDFAKTIATQGNRPPNNVNDAYIGYDVGYGPSIGISFGAPQSLSNYIGNNGDGDNWKERLTSTLKHFKTDVQIDGNLVISGKIIQQGTQSQRVRFSNQPQSKFATDVSMETARVEASGDLLQSQRSTRARDDSDSSQQFAYNLTLRDQSLMTGRLPSVYINRSATIQLSEVYCEVDAGSMVINLLNAGRAVLASPIECTPSGSASTTFVQDRYTVARGERLDHESTLINPNVHSLKVIVSYSAR